MRMNEVTLPATNLDKSEVSEKWSRTPEEERVEVKGYRFGLFANGEQHPFSVVPTMNLAKSKAVIYRRDTGEGVEVRDMDSLVLYYKLAPKLQESADEGFPPTRAFDKVLKLHGFVVKDPQGIVSPNKFALDPMKHATLQHTWTRPDLGKTHVVTQLSRDGTKSWIWRHEQPNGIMAPATGDTAGQLDRALTREYGKV